MVIVYKETQTTYKVYIASSHVVLVIAQKQRKQPLNSIRKKRNFVQGEWTDLFYEHCPLEKIYTE